MMNKLFLGFMVLLVGGTFILGKLLRRERMENSRLKSNQETLFSEVAFYRTRDSLSAAGVERLTLSNREFVRYCDGLKQIIADLQIKVGRLQTVSRSATESFYPIQTTVKDSIVPGRRDTLRCIDFEHAFLSFSGCMEQGRFEGQIICRDTLVQVVHRVPRKFWFIRWGTKAIRQEVVSRNPYSRIVFCEYIELKR